MKSAAEMGQMQVARAEKFQKKYYPKGFEKELKALKVGD